MPVYIDSTKGHVMGRVNSKRMAYQFGPRNTPHARLMVDLPTDPASEKDAATALISQLRSLALALEKEYK
ncbi:hypothetical protein [Brachybacterium sp. FME24]|uniref:hypothetical protein n=1 Tax=Brachybacterium sp. FME24 TaxID=2742605 RepID=UPI001D022745|nr:hypothetical protein [Brachybacterium sp. FME24]